MLDEQFWVALSFVIFVLATYKFITKAIVGMLDARSAKIKQELDQAASLRLEAETLLNIIKQKQAASEKDITELMIQAEKQAAKMFEAAKIQLEKNIETRKKMMELKIASHKQAMVKELTEKAIDVAINVVALILKDHLDNKTALLLVKNSLVNINKKLI